MMKIHTSYVDLLERHVRKNAASNSMPAEEMRSLYAKSVIHPEDELMVCSDEEVRVALVEMLKMLVDSESYHIDSTILAQKIHGISIVHPAPEAVVEMASHSEMDE